jgi:hypothetical protein
MNTETELTQPALTDEALDAVVGGSYIRQPIVDGIYHLMTSPNPKVAVWNNHRNNLHAFFPLGLLR